MEHVISALGLFVFWGIAYGMSENRKALNYRMIGMGIGLQFALGVLVLWTTPGRWVFDGANQAVLQIVRFSNAGAQMVFGEKYVEHFFAFAVLPSIIFFSALMAVLFHFGVMQKVVGAFSWVMGKTMRVSGAEATAASARVFVGGVEAAFTIQPYVPTMTRSEIMALLTAGMATIAGGVMAAFVGLGIDGGHLLAAQLMSAVGSLVFAKILIPETGVPLTLGRTDVAVKNRKLNVFDAACSGAFDGLKVAAIVAGVLIAFVAFTAMLNHVLGYAPSVADAPLSVERILGWLFRPVVFLTGAPWAETGALGTLLGKKIFLNEFLAYLDLSAMKESLSPRSTMLATYFLCGFGNLSAVAMQIGGLGSLFPEQRELIARLGFRAMIAGSLATISSACIAGILL